MNKEKGGYESPLFLLKAVPLWKGVTAKQKMPVVLDDWYFLRAPFRGKLRFPP